MKKKRENFEEIDEFKKRHSSCTQRDSLEDY